MLSLRVNNTIIIFEKSKCYDNNWRVRIAYFKKKMDR